jgi:hypothetical protein
LRFGLRPLDFRTGHRTAFDTAAATAAWGGYLWPGAATTAAAASFTAGLAIGGDEKGSEQDC